MKQVGLIGGMSWESTVLYYQWINEGVRARLGGLHSAPLLLNSVDFAEIETLQQAGEWDAAGQALGDAAASLQSAGADFLAICTNTMHKVAPAIQARVDLPLLHIVDPTATAIRAAGINTIGLLGTGFTMADDFYRGRMEGEHGIKVLVPTPDEQADVHQIIYSELCLGKTREVSRQRYLAIVDSLAAAGADAVILGCTEITLLIQQQHTAVPLFDTTALHAAAIVECLLGHDKDL